MVQLLLANGADPNAKDEYTSYVHVARERDMNALQSMF